jgi:Arc/MetJ-type ribon-helix-helix transcriptional regulator
MKQKISVTIDEKMVKLIEKTLADAQFRNRSHVIEYSLNKFLNKDLNDNKEK